MFQENFIIVQLNKKGLYAHRRLKMRRRRKTLSELLEETARELEANVNLAPSMVQNKLAASAKIGANAGKDFAKKTYAMLDTDGKVLNALKPKSLRETIEETDRELEEKRKGKLADFAKAIPSPMHDVFNATISEGINNIGKTYNALNSTDKILGALANGLDAANVGVGDRSWGSLMAEKNAISKLLEEPFEMRNDLLHTKSPLEMVKNMSKRNEERINQRLDDADEFAKNFKDRQNTYKEDHPLAALVANTLGSAVTTGGVGKGFKAVAPKVQASLAQHPKTLETLTQLLGKKHAEKVLAGMTTTAATETIHGIRNDGKNFMQSLTNAVPNTMVSLASGRAPFPDNIGVNIGQGIMEHNAASALNQTINPQADMANSPANHIGQPPCNGACQGMVCGNPNCGKLTFGKKNNENGNNANTLSSRLILPKWKK